MAVLLIQTIKKFRYAFITYISICIVFMWMLVAMAPTIMAEAEDFNKLIESYPEGVMKAFGVDTAITFSSLEGFLSMEIYSFMWPIVTIIMIIAFGSQTIAGEIDQGSIELLLAQPLSRNKIYLSKVLGGTIIILFFNFVSVYSTIPFALFYKADFTLKSYHILFLITLFFEMALYGITIFISSFSSSRARTVTLSAGLILVMYALNIVSSLQDSLEWLKYLSFFHYFDYQSALIDQKLYGLGIIVFVIVSTIGLFGGSLIFKRRDITV